MNETAGNLAERPKTPEVAREQLEAFALLAQFGGNLRRTGREIGMPWETLRDWRNRYPDVYAGIAQRVSEQIETRALTGVRELRLSALEAAQETVDAYRDDLANGEVKDKAGAAMRMATITAIAQDKQYLGEGKPTSIQGHTLTESVQALKRKLQQAGSIEAESVQEAQ